MNATLSYPTTFPGSLTSGLPPYTSPLTNDLTLPAASVLNPDPLSYMNPGVPLPTTSSLTSGLPSHLNMPMSTPLTDLLTTTNQVNNLPLPAAGFSMPTASMYTSGLPAPGNLPTTSELINGANPGMYGSEFTLPAAGQFTSGIPLPTDGSGVPSLSNLNLSITDRLLPLSTSPLTDFRPLPTTAPFTAGMPLPATGVHTRGLPAPISTFNPKATPSKAYSQYAARPTVGPQRGLRAYTGPSDLAALRGTIDLHLSNPDVAPVKTMTPKLSGRKLKQAKIIFRPRVAVFKNLKTEKMDLSCKIQIGRRTGKTSSAHSEGNVSVWPDTFSISRKREEEFAELKIKQGDIFSFYDKLGSALINLNNVEEEGKSSRWYTLRNGPQEIGSILVDCEYQPKI